MNGARLTQGDLAKLQFALPATEWNILVKPEDDGKAIPETITRRDFFSMKYVEWFRARNANGCHIYGRPYSTRYVLIDDVKPEGITRLKNDGLTPTAIVETSPNNFQVWITVSETEMLVPVTTKLAKLLEQRYSTDTGSADAYHLGRLPGLRNKKSKYQTYPGDGGPLVKLKTVRTVPVIPEAIGDLLVQARKLVELASVPSSSARGACVFDTDTILGDEPIEVYDRGNHVVTMSATYGVGEIKTAYDRILCEMKSNGYKPKVRQSGCGIDRSSQDIAVAGYLIRNCVSKNIVADVLAHGSEKATERGLDYIIRTVNAACTDIQKH